MTQQGPGLTLRIDEQLHKDLKRIAATNDRSLSSLVRVALKQYVEAEGIRESLARGHE